MTQEQHPITPPQELVREWAKGCSPYDVPADHIATQSARWGADQELEACCELLDINGCPGKWIDMLRAARRPNPKTLKERGREALQNIHAAVVMETGGRELDVLKEIVESLPD